MTFKLDDVVEWRVRWACSRGEFVKLRWGKVVEVIPPGERPSAFPGTVRGWGVERKQSAESYVVKTRDGCFWPRVDTLAAVVAENDAEKALLARGMRRSLFSDAMADAQHTTPASLAARLESIVSILKEVRTEPELLDASKHPRLDSVGWRLADAAMRFRAMVEAAGLTDIPGIHTRTRLGAILPDTACAPEGEIL